MEVMNRREMFVITVLRKFGPSSSGSQNTDTHKNFFFVAQTHVYKFHMILCFLTAIPLLSWSGDIRAVY